MVKITFRFDDVSPNTDLLDLSMMSGYLYGTFQADIIYAINIFGKANDSGSVYPGVPFKDKEESFFYNVDVARLGVRLPGNKASHGLVHSDHTKIGYKAQEMSILTSCNFLKSKIFVPPFNRWDIFTEQICKDNGIELIKVEDGWKSLEHNDFDPKHDKWYLHPWKWNINTLKEKLNACKDMGQLHEHSAIGAR